MEHSLKRLHEIHLKLLLRIHEILIKQGTTIKLTKVVRLRVKQNRKKQSGQTRRSGWDPAGRLANNE